MSSGATLLEILKRAQRERLKVSLYRDQSDEPFALGLYQTSGFSNSSHGPLEEVLAAGLAELSFAAAETILPDAAFLSDALLELERLTARSDLSFSLGVGFPAGSAPAYCRLEAFYYDGKLQRVALSDGTGDIGAVIATGLQQLRNYEPRAEAEKRPRPSSLAGE